MIVVVVVIVVMVMIVPVINRDVFSFKQFE